ncbi:MAG: hypothetical protein K8R69_12605, partial [Deltaproteobacteria bacterium]|nr:hypothetical protein [Deltaproteobacteria bacterium]
AEAFPILAENVSGETGNFSYQEFTELALSLEGRHQLANAAVAIEVLWALAVRGYPWSEEELKRGLAQAQNPGRLEWIKGTPTILFDGAHNPQALEALLEYLRERHAGRKLAVVFGMSKEKDRASALRLISALQADFYFTAFPNARSLDSESWRRAAKDAGIKGEFFEDPRDALSAASTRHPPPDLVVVTGSLFLVAALRPHF